MHKGYFVLLTSLLLSACGDEPAPPSPSAAEVEAQALKEAEDLCFATLHGDVELRSAALDKLTAVAEAYPGDARAHYMLGLCSLAASAEESNFLAFLSVEPALTTAMELDPENTRVAGFLSLTRFNRARQLHDQAGVDAAVQELTEASKIDNFNNFTLALAFSQLEPATGYPQIAVDKLLERQAWCTPAVSDCINNPVAPHRDPGFFMQLGDAYARVADKAKASEAYAAALAADGADTWPLAKDAQVWAAALDDRLALFADVDPKNDPPFFLSGARTCTGCHR